MKTLIVVDVQHDFFEGGALAVPNSNDIIPIINKLVDQFELVVFTQDWHPSKHFSFADNYKGKHPFDEIEIEGKKQVLWPVHCVQDTYGSDIHHDINYLLTKSYFVRKGLDPKVDSYSGFYDNEHAHSTGLTEFLLEKNVSDVYICGLATDYCVKYTAVDSVKKGFNTYVIADASRAVNLQPNDYDVAIDEMKSVGVEVLESSSLL